MEVATPEPMQEDSEPQIGAHDERMDVVREDDNAVPGESGEVDEPNGSAAGSDDEGEPTVPGAGDDSSEEEEDNEEELRKAGAGFIVDEDEDEGEDSDEARARRHRRKKKRRKQREQLDEDIDEEDRELMQENLGIVPARRKLVRPHHTVVHSDSEDSMPDEARPDRRPRDADRVDLQQLFDDEGPADDMDAEDDINEFIARDEDEDEEGESGEERRKERRRVERERRRAFGVRPEMAGIDPAAWEEIFEVFGDGTDYAWALEDEEGNDEVDEPVKADMKYTDVFEPSEIKARHLTEDDDIIRLTDIPERMQLSASTLSPTATLSLHEDFDLEQVEDEAADWVAPRLSSRIKQSFFEPGAKDFKLFDNLIQAVKSALRLMLSQNLEVPHIHIHARDLISHYDPENLVRTDLLSRDELWGIGTLGQKFKALMARKQALLLMYEKMGVKDNYFERDLQHSLDSVETIADTTEWLNLKHQRAKQDAMEMADDEGQEITKFKKPTRISVYELAKSSIVSQLANDFGISSQDTVRNFFNPTNKVVTTDQSISPIAYAERFTTDTMSNPERQLETARMIIATELGKDPQLRNKIRDIFKNEATVTVLPTTKGEERIDPYHPFHNFKYLKAKPVTKMLDVPQFLFILQAEHDHLITVEISLPPDSHHDLTETLYNAMASEAITPAGKAWNQQRRSVIEEALTKHLLPVGVKWTREWLREEVEDFVAKKCGDALHDRINSAPYKTEYIAVGEIPSVLAVSWGQGDRKKDAVHAIHMDPEGRVREHLKVDNLEDTDDAELFTKMVDRRKPDVIVVGGFSLRTRELFDRVSRLINGDSPPVVLGSQPAPITASNNQPSQGVGAWGADQGGWGQTSNAWGQTQTQNSWGGAADNSWSTSDNAWGATVTAPAPADSWGASAGGWGSNVGDGEKLTSSSERPKSGKEDKSESGPKTTPIVYVNDEVARIYQHSKRAEDEYGIYPVLARYCVGLARYVQSPLNEYAAIGADITALTFDDAQPMIPRDKLLLSLERALVNVVNTVGVDINRAVSEPYYQSLLPFVSGLGPRKAQLLVQKISALGGNLANRAQLIRDNLLPISIFLNCSGFLRIPLDAGAYDEKSKKRQETTDMMPHPLDSTRIHPQDYDLAKQMALDALGLDQDDYEEERLAAAQMAKLMTLETEKKANALAPLNLEDFAATLLRERKKQKRFTIDLIKAELLKPYGEQRRPFALPENQDILTMLTGETLQSLRLGTVVSVSVTRIKSGALEVRMDSGIEGHVESSYVSDDPTKSADDLVHKGKVLPALIMYTAFSNFPTEYQVRFSARASDVQSDAPNRRVAPDEYYDTGLEQRKKDLADRLRKRKEADQVRRIIKHPNFHNLNYKKAEEMLSLQQRGDVIIRPSTQGPDHIAVTWKVDDGLYQHIDVLDPNADASSQTVGSRLIVGNLTFSDLDDLIVNHVKAMARKVEELMAHEKFQKGSEADLHVYLDNAVKAQRGLVRSVYAFGLNRERPGFFNLSFKTNLNAPVQTWPVKILPNGYKLFDSEAGSVADLCDAFKTRVMQQNMSAATGGQTPYAGGRTPGITPGGATPGHRSSRHTPGHASSRMHQATPLGKTPNPYAIAAAKTPNPYAQVPPTSFAPAPPKAAVTQANTGWGALPATGNDGWGASWGGAAATTAWGPTPPSQPQPPKHPDPAAPAAPPGMHPSRAAMLQNQPSNGGWGGAGF